MKDETQKVIAATFYLVILLIYINCLFYMIYKLPFGMLDVDGYLYHSGDQDPRLQHVNNGKRLDLIHNWQYTIFYRLLAQLGNPRITFLWLPPILLGLIIIEVYFIYAHNGKGALNKTIIFVCMTYAIPFFYTAALYRQILGMSLVLGGYNLLIRGKKIGYIPLAIGFLTHIHLLPIAGIYKLADWINRHKWHHCSALVVVGAIITLKSNIIMSIGILSGRPQPSFYIQLFTLTNPLLLIYGLKRIRKDTPHILLILLLITMPLTDQSRGLIFLHILLASIAYDKYRKENNPLYYLIIILILSYLWWGNMLGFLLKSMIKDGVERGLNLNPIINYLTTHQ